MRSIAILVLCSIFSTLAFADETAVYCPNGKLNNKGACDKEESYWQQAHNYLTWGATLGIIGAATLATKKLFWDHGDNGKPRKGKAFLGAAASIVGGSGSITAIPLGKEGAESAIQDTATSKSQRPSLRLGISMASSVLRTSISYLRTASSHQEDAIEHADEAIQTAARNLIEISNATIVVEGQENIPVSGSYVVMPNHQSLFDVAAVSTAFPRRLRMVYKESLDKVPFFGRALRRAGFVSVTRKNTQRAIQQLQDANVRLDNEISICIFPEGTRSENGELGELRAGGFHIAIQTGRPIIPVWIEGANNVIPVGSMRVTPGQTVTVRIGTPISTQGYTKSNMKELMEKVRMAMEGLRVGQ